MVDNTYSAWRAARVFQYCYYTTSNYLLTASFEHCKKFRNSFFKILALDKDTSVKTEVWFYKKQKSGNFCSDSSYVYVFVFVLLIVQADTISSIL